MNEMVLNEPTTGEIVRALRCDGCTGTCGECIAGYKIKDTDGYEYHACDRNELDNLAADRLESQECEIEELKAEAIVNALENAERIANMTARAEQAERERDALVKSVDRLVEAWENFKSPALIEFLKQWRGLPQDGEGV